MASEPYYLSEQRQNRAASKTNQHLGIDGFCESLQSLTIPYLALRDDFDWHILCSGQVA